MKFRWDPGKRDKTILIRGIDFADVVMGFADPDRVTVEDKRRNYGEPRYNMLAKCDGRIFHITFTPRGDVTWIISARKANKRERRRYAQS